jgi:hypothetical protein
LYCVVKTQGRRTKIKETITEKVKMEQEIEFRVILTEGVRFSAPAQFPWAYPVFYTMGIGSLFPGGGGLKRPGCGVNRPPHLALRLKKE